MAFGKTGLILLKHRGLRGGVVFIGLFLVGCWFLSLRSVMEFLDSNITSGIASLTAWVLNTIGLNVISSGISLSGHGFSIDIKYGCNAIYEIMVFSAAVIAYPISIKDKIAGVIFGAAVIYILNLIRVLLLFIAGTHFLGLFEITHENIAQNIFMFCLVILWLFWITRATRRASAK